MNAERGDPANEECRDSFESVSDGPEVEVREKGSRFIGQALQASSEDELRRSLAAIRRRYHDATHHCHALRLGPPEAASERSDDDGEPAGTAGAPILAILRGEELLDAAVVVTRYFGGVKLGTGGLTRAYAGAARAALAAARRRTVWLDRVFRVSCSYEDLGAVEALLAREARVVVDVRRDFAGAPSLAISARRSAASRLAAAIVETTSGRARISPGE